MEENQDSNERFKPSWFKKKNNLFYCLWRDEGAYQPVSPSLVVKSPQYYQCSAHLYSKSDTDITQSIQCSKCNWNALIKKKMSISVSNNGKRCLKGKQNTPGDSWPCLFRYMAISPFLPIAYPPKLRVELTGKIQSQLLITYLALHHQSQELGGYN